MFGHDLKPYEIFGYPFFFGLLAVVVANSFPSDFMTVFLYAFEVNVAFAGMFYLWHESCKYVDGQAPEKPNTPAPVAGPVKQYLNLNTSDDKPVYSQEIVSIKVDAVKKFNQTLLDQQKGNLEIHMDETWWLKKQPGADESEWIKAGGVGRADFIDMRDRGVAWGAYKIVGGQGKRVPHEWRKISQLAQGYPLPRWDQLPKQ